LLGGYERGEYGGWVWVWWLRGGLGGGGGGQGCRQRDAVEGEARVAGAVAGEGGFGWGGGVLGSGVRGVDVDDD
jgi:hypothetical protein